MKNAILAGMLLAFGAGVCADDFSYSYVDLYGFAIAEDVDDNAFYGGGATLSVEGAGGGIFRLSIGSGEVDKVRNRDPENIGLDTDYMSYSLFLGSASQVNEDTSLWMGVGVTYEDYEGLPVVDEDVYSGDLSFGARYWLLPRVEVNGALVAAYIDNGHSDDQDIDYGVDVGLRLYPFKRLSIGASVNALFDQRITTGTASLRYDY